MLCSWGSSDDTGNSVMTVCKLRVPCWCGVKEEEEEDVVPILERGHSERCRLGQLVGSEPGFPWARSTQGGQMAAPDVSMCGLQGLASLSHSVLCGSLDLQPPSPFSCSFCPPCGALKGILDPP